MGKLNLLLPIVSAIMGPSSAGISFPGPPAGSALALNRCDHCWGPKDLAGLVWSAAVQRFPGMIPSVAFETAQRSLMVQ
ncbi:MAG: hypothetical protein ABSC19_17785 [Syntrophorhabdales bacterium]|jgi:hypothetical protein